MEFEKLSCLGGKEGTLVDTFFIQLLLVLLSYKDQALRAKWKAWIFGGRVVVGH